MKWKGLGIRKVILGNLPTYKTNQWGEVGWRRLGEKVREGPEVREELVRQIDDTYREIKMYLFTYIICHNGVGACKYLTEHTS